MLTIQKVKTYERFKGDIDGFSRARGAGDTSGITDDDWKEIYELCSRLYLVASGKASDRFRAEVEEKLHALTADEPTREALRRLAMSEY